uniref:Histidine kinase-like ATPase, C-terminal domain-containing protein n=1 Tax=Tanacetum cinerariifolium TaxID=118510 RepID=A0A6L2NUJ7_TANCI|nr:histidine kinase-like ATPase, C-terminal domain-containing protein [Tanacetum cinerariifolium]
MSFILEEINKEGPVNTNSPKCVVDVKIDVEPTEQDILVASKHVSKGCGGITLEDVLTFAKEFFFSNQVLDNISSHLRKQSVFLREICKLESSLTQHFSADDFASLGFGDIFTSLVEHISLLPTIWKDCLTRTDKVKKPSVKVCMSQSYLLEFLSEADDFTADLLTNLSKNGDHVSSSIMLFSSTLSDFREEKGFSDTHAGTNDAIELFRKAPIKQTIDQSAGDKLHDLNAKESWALLADLALYDNESCNDPRDFAKTVKVISLPHDVLSTSDRRLIELENQVQCLMESHFAPTQPTQIPNNPLLNTHPRILMKREDARLSKFEANFKQQQSKMTNKIDIVLKAITDRIAGALPSDMIKYLKLSTSQVLSACSYLTVDPKCSSYPSTLINAIKGEVSAKRKNPDHFVVAL